MKADSCEYQEPGRPGKKKIVFYIVYVHIGITVINSQYSNIYAFSKNKFKF